MSQLQNLKGKAVDNYILTRMIQKTPLAQFWLSFHKILKKQFVVKKIISATTDVLPGAGTCPALNIDHVKSEIAILSSIKLNGIPKCQKLIRTSTNIYLVYNIFPLKSLETTLNQSIHCSSYHFELMLKISEQLAKLHKSGVVLLSLSENHIYLQDKKCIFFGDWTVASNIHNEVNYSLVKQLGQIPKFVKETDLASTVIDIVQLGKLFDRIVNKIKEELAPLIQQKMKSMIKIMTSESLKNQNYLSQIIKTLKNIIITWPDNELNKPDCLKSNTSANSYLCLTKIPALIVNCKSDKTISLAQAELTYSTKTYLEQLHDRAKNGPNNDARSLLRAKSQHLTNFQAKNNIKVQKTMKIILQKRGFIAFLCDQIIFIYTISLQLAYLLIKKVRVLTEEIDMINQALRIENITIYVKINSIIREELRKAKQIIMQFNNRPQIRKHISTNRDLKTFSDQQINNILLSVIEDQLKIIGKGKSYENKQEFIFKLFLLSRSIKYGSLDKFWSQEYNLDKLPENQTFINKNRKMGMRFLQRKIEETLKVK